MVKIHLCMAFGLETSLSFCFLYISMYSLSDTQHIKINEYQLQYKLSGLVFLFCFFLSFVFHLIGRKRKQQLSKWTYKAGILPKSSGWSWSQIRATNAVRVSAWVAGTPLHEPSLCASQVCISRKWGLDLWPQHASGGNGELSCEALSIFFPFFLNWYFTKILIPSFWFFLRGGGANGSIFLQSCFFFYHFDLIDDLQRD